MKGPAGIRFTRHLNLHKSLWSIVFNFAQDPNFMDYSGPWYEGKAMLCQATGWLEVVPERSLAFHNKYVLRDGGLSPEGWCNMAWLHWHSEIKNHCSTELTRLVKKSSHISTSILKFFLTIVSVSVCVSHSAKTWFPYIGSSGTVLSHKEWWALLINNCQQSFSTMVLLYY